MKRKNKSKYKKDKAFQLEKDRRYNLGLAVENANFVCRSIMRKKDGLDYFIKKLELAKELLEQMKSEGV